MEDVYDEKGKLVISIPQTDLIKHINLSEYLYGYYQHRGRTDETERTQWPFSSTQIKAVLRYLNRPTAENYYLISDEAKDFFVLQIPDRLAWLKDQFDRIDRLRKKTKLVLVWDTSPDFGEVVTNLIQTIVYYNFRALYIPYDLIETKATIASSLPNLQIVHDAKDVPIGALWFDKYPIFTLTDIAVNSYFYVSPIRDRLLPITLGGKSLSSLHVNQRKYEYGTLTPDYRLSLSLTPKLTDLISSTVPQLNSINLYSPQFDIPPFNYRDLQQDIDEYVASGNVVIVKAALSSLLGKKKAVGVSGTLSQILSGYSTPITTELVISPFDINETIPDNVSVLRIGWVGLSKIEEQEYVSPNAVKYYEVPK